MKNNVHRPLSFAVAAIVALGSITGAAVAQPNSDVYANPKTQPASNVATGPVDVARAPVPGLVTAYAQVGPAATELSFERPVVVAAPYVGRGQIQSAGGALRWTGLVAGN